MAKADPDGKKGDKIAAEDSSAQEDLEKKDKRDQDSENAEDADDEQESEESGKTDAASDEASKSDEDEDADADADADANGKPHQKAIPYERFQEVNNRLKAAEAKLAQLEGSRKEKTWDDLSLEELREARRYYREQKNDRMVEFLDDKLIEKKASQIVEDRESKRDFKETRARSWTAVIQDYPDLKNPNSEHFRLTKELIESDPRYSKEPEGYAVAARVVASDLLRKQLQGTKKKQVALKHDADTKLKKDALESGSRPGGGGSTTLEKLEQAAINSGSPYSAEWRTYMRAAAKAKKE